MCHVKVYTKQCTTCRRVFRDRSNIPQVYIEKNPCPYVEWNRLRFAGCGQRTRQERCGRMDFGECTRCIERMWNRY